MVKPLEGTNGATCNKNPLKKKCLTENVDFEVEYMDDRRFVLFGAVIGDSFTLRGIKGANAVYTENGQKHFLPYREYNIEISITSRGY